MAKLNNWALAIHHLGPAIKLLPLIYIAYWVYRSVDALAGKVTIVSPSVATTVTAIVALAVGSGGTYLSLSFVAKVRKGTTVRLRTRVQSYEKKYGVLSDVDDTND
jgi:hypothetical protein